MSEPSARLPAGPPGDGDRPVLTERQLRVLTAVIDVTAQRGHAPTFREIADLAGVSSPSTVVHHVSTLIRQGLLHRPPRTPRAMGVTDAGLDALAWHSGTGPASVPVTISMSPAAVRALDAGSLVTVQRMPPAAPGATEADMATACRTVRITHLPSRAPQPPA
ncbi:hypothetical protein ACFWNK_37185 [Streptomyces sp. NPDC058417]|uniref:LexA family protein n=1 Tax=unclassified Streptomyces TaxID=2593676 RepID=UPI00364E881A